MVSSDTRVLKEILAYYKENPECWVQFGSVCTVITESGETNKGFCLSGAVSHFSRKLKANWGQTMQQLRQSLGSYSIIAWNDATGRTHEEIIALLEKAIAMAEKE
jgi:hypothetical protein